MFGCSIYLRAGGTSLLQLFAGRVFLLADLNGLKGWKPNCIKSGIISSVHNYTKAGLGCWCHSSPRPPGILELRVSWTLMGQVGGSQHCPVPGSSLEVRLLAQWQQSRPLSVRFFHTQPDSMDTHVHQKFILNSKTARHISRRVGSAPVCQGLEGWEPLAWAFLWTQPTAPAHWWGPCVHLSLREPYQPPRPLHPFAQGQILHPGHFTITRPRPDQYTH